MEKHVELRWTQHDIVRCEDSPNKHSKNKDATNKLSQTMIPTSSKDATLMPVPTKKTTTHANHKQSGTRKRHKKGKSDTYSELNKTKAKHGFAKLCLVVTDERGEPANPRIWCLQIFRYRAQGLSTKALSILASQPPDSSQPALGSDAYKSLDIAYGAQGFCTKAACTLASQSHQSIHQIISPSSHQVGGRGGSL